MRTWVCVSTFKVKVAHISFDDLASAGDTLGVFAVVQIVPVGYGAFRLLLKEDAMDDFVMENLSSYRSLFYVTGFDTGRRKILISPSKKKKRTSRKRFNQVSKDSARRCKNQIPLSRFS